MFLTLLVMAILFLYIYVSESPNSYLKKYIYAYQLSPVLI